MMDGGSKHRRTHSSGASAVEKGAGSNAGRPSSKPGGIVKWLSPSVLLTVIAISAMVVGYEMWALTSASGSLPLLQSFYEKDMVEMTTKYGPFTIELYPEHAPKTVANFLQLVQDGFYSEDTGFYRNEPKYALQGGGFLIGKKSPYGKVPVEYSLPSEERMVVLARGHKSDSGDSEFSIMLHDNTASNKPREDDPGYTAFGRVVQGWPTVEFISRKMSSGFVAKDEAYRQTKFEGVKLAKTMTIDHPVARRRLEELTYIIETPFTVVILSEPDDVDTAELKRIFAEHNAITTTKEITGRKPYEREAADALTGSKPLPVVFIDKKPIGGLETVKALDRNGFLNSKLESAGAVSETTVWNAIKKNPLVVFSKSYCPYCKKAKETLAELKAEPLVMELDLREDGPGIARFLFDLTDRTTVPNVFIRGKSIGGGDEVEAMMQSGELEKKLKEAGAI